ncbi:UNVERIFIED_CONTAM: hypothetical protein HDU68_001331, partial [Siphonaria sp. JEL0065]
MTPFLLLTLMAALGFASETFTNPTEDTISTTSKASPTPIVSDQVPPPQVSNTISDLNSGIHKPIAIINSHVVEKPRRRDVFGDVVGRLFPAHNVVFSKTSITQARADLMKENYR